MTTPVSPRRRVRRGDVYSPLRYWSAFALFSALVHVLTLTSMSDLAIDMLQRLTISPAHKQPLVYVGLLYQPPTPLNRPNPAPGPKPAAPARPSKSAGRTVIPPLPERRTEARQAAAFKGDPPVKTPEKVSTVEKAKKTPEQASPDISALNDIAFKDMLEEGSVVVIRGTNKTIVAANRPRPSPAPVKPPFAPYSTAKPLDMPVPHPRDAVAQDPMANRTTAALSMPPAGKETPAHREGPLPLSVTRTEASAGGNYKDITSIEEKQPLPITGSGKTASQVPLSPPGPDAQQGAPAKAQAEKEPAAFKAVTSIPQEPSPVQGPKVITITGQEEKAAPPLIKFTSPAEGDTDRGLVDVQGVVSGSGVGSVFLTLGDREMEVLVRDGSFGTMLALNEGRNVLEAVAVDADGRVARDQLTVNYVPAPPDVIISFTSPVENSIIDALKDHNVAVSGTVRGIGAGFVRLYINSTIVDAPVKGGRFYYKTPVEAEENTLYAEARDESGKTFRSRTITFKAVNLEPSDLTVTVTYSGGGGRPVLTTRWVVHPLAGNAAPPAPRFKVSGDDKNGLASVSEAAPGIYTVGVKYDAGPGAAAEAVFEVTLYGYDPSRKKTRRIGPLRLQGKGYLPAVRVLLPEGVFWEDDSWFSGIIEGGSGTTKYKEPEGIVWKEEE